LNTFIEKYADRILSGFRTMLITRSDDGYFGLRQSLSGDFGEASTRSSKIIHEILLDRLRVITDNIDFITDNNFDCNSQSSACLNICCDERNTNRTQTI